MGSEKFSNAAKSGYNKGTIRSDIRYLVVSKDVRRHRLISIDYITTLRCHGRGREFESRRPRHSFQSSPNFTEPIVSPLDLCSGQSSEIGACKCIYIAVYISERHNMAIARVFKSGNSQAVRLPKTFRVKSTEVEIFRRGDEIVLREKAGGMVRVLDLLAELPADMFPKKRKDPHPQRRKGL